MGNIKFNAQKQEIKKGQTSNKAKKPLRYRILSIIGIAFTVLLTPILIINLTLTIKGYINPKEVPTFMGVAPLFVISGSMEPNIHVGDLIFIKSCDVDTLNGPAAGEKFGDFISFQVDERTVVTHAIVEIREDKDGNRLFLTQGTANNAPDQNLVPANQVIGIYNGRIGQLGYVANFLMSSAGIVICIGLPLLVFVIYEVLRRRAVERATEQSNAELLKELKAFRAAQTEAPGNDSVTVDDSDKPDQNQT